MPSTYEGRITRVVRRHPELESEEPDAPFRRAAQRHRRALHPLLLACVNPHPTGKP
ncbi:hypothetical protein ACFC0D_13390 [Streptomyces sp. NPDC056222]|uniref:hypothetical protein n=1 Tax=Streptomyces sp. NPDC056222 TaxID=3345749 RepID=UPI0035E141B6